MKYFSDNYTGNPYASIHMPHHGSFDAMVRLKADKEIGDKMNKITGRRAEIVRVLDRETRRKFGFQQ